MRRFRTVRLTACLIVCVCAFLWMTPAGAEPKIRYVPIRGISLNLPAKPSGDAVVVLHAPPERAFVAFGRWMTLGDPQMSAEQLLTFTKGKAAELGADLIVLVRDEATTYGGSGPGGFGSLPRGRDASISSARTIHALFGVYSKATLGLKYQDRRNTLGRWLVSGFRPMSKAPGAGILVGDDILEFDGIWIGDNDRLPNYLYNLAPGRVVKLLVKRGETTLVIEVPMVPNDG